MRLYGDAFTLDRLGREVETEERRGLLKRAGFRGVEVLRALLFRVQPVAAASTVRCSLHLVLKSP